MLTSRGKPKAVLVNVEDYKRLQAQEQSNALQQWDEWMAEARQLSAEILARRQGQPIDVAQIEQAAKAELEGRWDECFVE